MISKATHRGLSDRTITCIDCNMITKVHEARIGQHYLYRGRPYTLVHISFTALSNLWFYLEDSIGMVETIRTSEFVSFCDLQRKKVTRKSRDRSVQYVHLFLDGSSMVTLSKTYRGKKTLVQTFVAGASK